jgi:flagellar basal-body rod protein FlgF
MENTYLIGLSRQVALVRELDVIANNLANVNTSGFKASNMVFEQYLMPIARTDDFLGGDRQFSYVQDRNTWRNLSQGAVQQTGNPLDIAIDGAGFLVAQTPDGERYTRNGALQINAQGQLVTTEGYQILGERGPIIFQPLDHSISVSPDGRISAIEGASRIETLRGKIRVVNFTDPQQLQNTGSNNLLAPEGLAPQPVQNPRMIQGSIEKSNVHGVVEMSRMIEITRTYAQIAQLMQQQSDLQRTGIQQLAEVPV